MRQTSTWLALLVGASLFIAGTAAAQAVGGAELRLLEIFLTRWIGITIGLGVAVYGIFKFSQSETGFGITLVLVGAAITFAPGIFNGFRMVVEPMAKALSGRPN